MTSNAFAFFATIKQIEKSSDVFEILNKKKLYYYYFQKTKLYYIFIYGKTETETDSFLSSLEIITELNTKKRKIRSLRGYILHVLSYIEDETSLTVLSTNLQPRFWVKVKDVIKQNKKDGLLNFLLSVTDNNQKNSELTQQIEDMKNEIFLLKKNIEMLNVSGKLEEKKNVILDIESILDNEQVDSSSLSNKSFKQQEFYLLSQLDEETQIAIIQEGFQFLRRRQIKLKEYYEGTSNKYSLFNLRGFSIKYDTIRKSDLYKKYTKYQYTTT